MLKKVSIFVKNMVGLYNDHSIDDIEDLTTNLSGEDVARERSRRDLPPRVKKVKSNKFCADQRFEAESVIPGTQKIFVKTWGCSHNNSDSEYMAGQLASFGYIITGRF